METIKTVIADDHNLFREGLRRILSLEKDLLVVGEAAYGDEVAPVVARFKPDVLLLDLEMPRGEVVQTLLEVSEKSPTTKTLILTAFCEEEGILNTAKGGAKGYILKGTDSQTLLKAIKTVHRGEIWVDRELPYGESFTEIARRHEARVPGGAEGGMIQVLTKRELEILTLVAEGLTNDEIGKRVFISEKTVKTHLNHIFDKLNVKNRFKAALFLMHRHGAISSPRAP